MPSVVDGKLRDGINFRDPLPLWMISSASLATSLDGYVNLQLLQILKKFKAYTVLPLFKVSVVRVDE